MSERTIGIGERTVAFDLTGPLPSGRTVVEASAGTGKTYAISALATRSLAEGVVGIDQLLVVTFTRAAAGELRDRIRAKLRTAAAVLDGAPIPDSDSWMSVLVDGPAAERAERSRRVHAALGRFDEATITTIHGFCQQALAQSGLRGSGDPGASLVESNAELVADVCRDLLVRELVDDPYRLSTDGKNRPVQFVGLRAASSAANAQPNSPAKVERDFVATVNAVMTNGGAVTAPSPDVGGIAGRWAALVAEAVATIGARQRERRQLSYDRLVGDLRDALVDPAGGRALAEQLATRFGVVLVDEFQDTDRLQWDIFDTAFGDRRLIVVGDPKQAIYRFRGADVHAYLAAVAGAARASLATNHRSDRRLLDGLALLFDGVTLGHRDIAFAPVAPWERSPRSSISEPGARAAIHLRVVPDVAEIAHTKKGHDLESGAVQRIVLADVAGRIRSLLDSATITLGMGPDAVTRPVRPDDVAVLVPSQRRAGDTAAVLREWGIASVRARTGSVLDTDAAIHWRLLLAGLAAPTRARIAKAAGLSWFFGLDPADLADTAEGDAAVVGLQQQLAVLADHLRTHGIGALYEHLRSTTRLVDSLLASPSGDRDLADVDHIGDLLVAALHGEPPEPLHVQRTLDRLIADDAERGASEATMRRIETDAGAVHITTIHAAKGLEYPIVLLPFGYTERPNAMRPYVFNDGTGTRVVDVASWVAWADGAAEGSKPAADAFEDRRRRAIAEVDGDSLRALYVAMTRAKHRLELWWAPTQRSETSALGRLLFDRDDAGPVLNSAIGSDYERAHGPVSQLRALAAASKGAIAVYDVPVDQPVRRPLDLAVTAEPALAAADGSSRAPLADRAWRVWSFTAITAAAETTDAATPPAVPIAGGLDEGVDAEHPDLDRADLDRTDLLGDAAPAGLLTEVVGGAVFGTMVHSVLEEVDFTSTTLTDDLRRLVDERARAGGLTGSLDPIVVAGGLEAAIATPLGPLFGGRALGDLAPADRLAELTFDLELARSGGAALGTTLADALDVDDPFVPYARDLARQLEPIELAGWMTGSIDAVLRVGGRYVIVDYKTNRLPSYRPDHLVEAMAHSNYPLQALLYSVALHRYLRWRLGDSYRPTEHLGGTAYLFVRGMTGPGTPTLDGHPHGVCSWRPSVAAIAAVDELLVQPR